MLNRDVLADVAFVLLQLLLQRLAVLLSVHAHLASERVAPHRIQLEVRAELSAGALPCQKSTGVV